MPDDFTFDKVKQNTRAYRRCVLLMLLIAASAGSVPGQVVTKLKLEKQTRVPESVHEIVAIGGPRDSIKCDQLKNLWIPALRGYSSTVSAIVRYSPPHTMQKFDIDEWPEIADGSVEYFSPLPDGGVLALVRSVVEYSDGNNRPAKYGDTFATKFTALGKPSNIVKLAIGNRIQQASGLAELSEGWLLVGWARDGGAVRVQAFLFDRSGNFESELDLPGSRVKPSNKDLVPTEFIYTPTVIRDTDGTVLVLRGFTNQPIYRFSSKGELITSIKLNPDGLNFWSPRLVGNQLFVQAEVSRIRTGSLGSIPIVHGRSAFAVFSLKTGEINEVLTLDGQDTAVVGCYADQGPALTLINQEFDGESFWVIQTLKPAPAPLHSKTN
jgi:hypothetical protein